jgi:hypothetical protein
MRKELAAIVIVALCAGITGTACAQSYPYSVDWTQSVVWNAANPVVTPTIIGVNSPHPITAGLYRNYMNSGVNVTVSYNNPSTPGSSGNASFVNAATSSFWAAGSGWIGAESSVSPPGIAGTVTYAFSQPVRLGVSLHDILRFDETNTVTVSNGGFTLTDQHFAPGVSLTNAGSQFTIFGNGAAEAGMDADLLTTAPVTSIQFSTNSPTGPNVSFGHAFAVVPEPSTALLLAIATTLVVPGRRRRGW